MDTWEKSLQEFLKPWKRKKEVVAVLVCGSYVTGNPSEHSDIDTHIILKEGTQWRERGNKIIDGILVEYFANSPSQIRKYLEGDYKRRKRIIAHMLTSGKVLFDKDGSLRELVLKAKSWERKPFPKMKREQREFSKYQIWDMLDNLEELFKAKTSEFTYAYHSHLDRIFDIYSTFVGFERILPHKVIKALDSKRDKNKYRSQFPDKKFVELYTKAVEAKKRNLMVSTYRSLTNHVLRKMGGFEIDGWKLRSKLQK